MLQALCVPNLFGENTPEKIKNFLKTYNKQKITDSYRFTFALEDLNFEPKDFDNFLESNLKYGVKVQDGLDFSNNFFRSKYETSYNETNLLDYLKPLILKLKAFEDKLNELQPDPKYKTKFYKIQFTFITINETIINPKGGIHDWHKDRDYEYTPSRQFSILLTEHPNTEFSINQDNPENIKDTLIKQCITKQINSTSYWNSKVFHRKPIFDIKMYTPIRSICSILFNFRKVDTIFEMDYYNSPEHFNLEKEALKQVFGSITDTQLVLPPLKRNPPSLVSGGKKKKK